MGDELRSARIRGVAARGGSAYCVGAAGHPEFWPPVRQTYAVDICEGYYPAIGRVTVAGGQLEYMVAFMVAGLADLRDQRVLRILAPDSFAGMSSACRQLIGARARERELALLPWLDHAGDLWRRRNEVVHAWWHVSAWADDGETPLSIARLRQLPRRKVRDLQTATLDFASPQALMQLAEDIFAAAGEGSRLGTELDLHGFGGPEVW
ncbi:MAG TPA: hypothetical protein VK662_06050 [Acidothermaceae bacterium]|jgi:hypothetical protein|nr:hypothetical protein [Acidothermaceae bacterium]